MDVLSFAQRRYNMSQIKGKNTKLELLVRKELYAKGFRYRLHVTGLPGKPDLVFPRYRTVLLIHGCFWHGHSCPLFKLPQTRTEFWANKISTTRKRDRRHVIALKQNGWAVLTVWECSLRGPMRRSLSEVIDCCTAFIKGREIVASTKEIRGMKPRRS